MNQITEFEPDQLIVIHDFNDMPDDYVKLLKKYLVKYYGHKGAVTSDSWDFGEEIRVIHWEWHPANTTEYKLLIDVTGYPAGEEEGFIAMNGDMVFKNDGGVLTPMKKNHVLLSRREALETIRKLDASNPNGHVQEVIKIVNDLKQDLQEESVDEEEFKNNVEGQFVHYSSDDASDVSSATIEDIENEL